MLEPCKDIKGLERINKSKALMDKLKSYQGASFEH